MTSSDLAAWVQAIGSIAAVIGAGLVAVYQSKKQHESALKVQREDRRYERVELTKTLLELSNNCEKVFTHFIRELNNERANVHDIAEGRRHLDFPELLRLEQAVMGIPLHSLPAKLVTYTMMVRSTVRQFREKVESALKHHREMDAAAFEDLFRTTAEMKDSLHATCMDIEKEGRAIEKGG